MLVKLLASSQFLRPVFLSKAFLNPQQQAQPCFLLLSFYTSQAGLFPFLIGGGCQEGQLKSSLHSTHPTSLCIFSFSDADTGKPIDTQVHKTGWVWMAIKQPLTSALPLFPLLLQTFHIQSLERLDRLSAPSSGSMKT